MRHDSANTIACSVRRNLSASSSRSPACRGSTIRVRPTSNYGVPIADRSLGSNHITFRGKDHVIRLTTDGPIAYIEREAPFVLTKPIHMVLGPDEALTANIETTCREFADRTRDYWKSWVRRLSLAYDWQDAIIRAAISLKLSNFEETGGIVAALTTSIPEAPGSGRTWDYRYCWLRDAYFVVKALNRLGATQTMEHFIAFILGIASEPNVRPVYSVVPSDAMDEVIAPHLNGYRNDGPVRVGNAAVLQTQHDTFGSVVLAAMPMFFDRRLPQRGDEALFRLLETLGEKAKDLALHTRCGHLGISRTDARPHLFRVDVLGGVQPARSDRCSSRPQRSRGLLDRHCGHPPTDDSAEQAWNPSRNAFTAAFGVDDLDASVLLLPEIGLIETTDPRFLSTVNAVERELVRGKHVMRYASEDDFGLPEFGFPHLPLLADRCLVVAWPPGGSARSVRRCAHLSQSLRLAVGRHPSTERSTLG